MRQKNLSNDELQDRVDVFIKAIEDDGLDHDEFMELFASHRFNTRNIAKAAFVAKNYFPPEMYIDADTDVRDGLIKILSNPECGNRTIVDNVLLCLAIIGDDVVKKQFWEWEKNPMPWRKSLYVGSEFYAQKGGYTFDEEGNEIKLVYDKCHELRKGDYKISPIKIGKVREADCPMCEMKLVDIVTINGNDKRLKHIGINGTVTSTICVNCVSFYDMYSKYELDGSANLIGEYEAKEECYVKPEELEVLANNTYSLGEEVHPHYGIHNNANTIGGFPHFVQDLKYLDCPTCGKKMKYLTQLHWDTIIEDMEGMLYIDICLDCNVTGAFHQQT